MTDEYTMEMRLCDDRGMVSKEPIVEDREPPSLDASYLERLNRLRNMTRRARGDKPEYIEEPFICTGSAHLAAEHMRCTSPAHDRAIPLIPDALPLGVIVPFRPGNVPENWIQLQGQTLTHEERPELVQLLTWALPEGNTVYQIWINLGGKVAANSVTLPNVDTYEKANFFLYGDAYQGLAPQPMVLAIKATRSTRHGRLDD